MTGLYRKWGRVLRYENGTTIGVDEAGEAYEQDGFFRAAPIETREQLPAPDAEAVLSCRAAFNDLGDGTAIERLLISDGVTRHEVNGTSWLERSQRVHVSLIKPPLRALIDLASFDIDFLRSIAGALARATTPREPPPRIRLAPNVAAALLPSLLGELAMEQHGGGLDGKGQTVETRAVTADPPPNWYRPGYSVRPVRAWLNLRALPFGRIDKHAPLALALLAPVEGTMLRVLCIDGGNVFPTTLDATGLSGVSGEEPVWYPYAAGSFGVEMML